MTKSSAKRVRAQSVVTIGAKLSRAGLMLGTALGCSIAVFTAFKPTPVLAADVNCAPDPSGSTTSGPEFCQNAGDKITYTANGNLTVVLDGVIATPGGVQIDASGGKYNVTVYDLFTAGFISNNATDGIGIKSKDGNISIDTTTGGANTNGSGTFVYGVKDGINVNNFVAGGTGTIGITTGANANGRNFGIYARGYNGALTINSAGNLSYGHGIYAHTNSGDIVVNAHGDVAGDFDNNGTGVGIQTFQNSGGTTHITVDGGVTVSGGSGVAGNNGVNALSGLGPVTVDVNGTVRDGLVARSNGPTAYGAVTVNNSGLIYGDQGDAVKLRALDGAVTFYESAGGQVNASSGRGVYAFAGDGGISVKTLNDTYIGGSKGGVYASTLGSKGSIDINTGGGVYSSGGDGISARASGGDITITTGDIVRGDPGIVATNTGTGNVTENINAKVYATAGGVVVTAEAGTVDIEVGNGAHIYSQNAGAGLDGIRATVKDGNIVVNGIDAGVGITADGDGIHAVTTLATAAGDAIDVNWQGSINSGKTGVYAAAQQGDVHVTVGGTITAGTDGVYAVTSNGGAISVSTGDIAAAKGAGVLAHAYGDGGINVTTGAIKGQYGGVIAYTTKGDITVNAGAINTYAAGTEGGDGINAHSASGQVNVYAHGDIDAFNRGIVAISGDTGSVYVTAYGKVSSATNRGIYARSHDGDAQVRAEGYVSGATTGIDVSSGGAGRVYVLATGGVTAKGGNAIRAESRGGDVIVGYADGGSVLAGAISATKDGVNAYTYGSGRVLVAGDATATIDAGRYGVYTHAENGLTSIFMQGDITAKYTGVVAFATGTGEIDINVANVTGKQGAGVYAVATGGPIYLTASGTVQGAGNGAYLHTNTTGNIHVEGQNFYGGDGDGVFAKVDGDGSISIKGATIGGGQYGVYSKVSGAGSIYLNATGAVSGTGGAGVFARLSNAANTGDITVVTGGEASGGTHGVYALNVGSGHVSVTTGGAYGQTKDGIFAGAASGYVYVHSTGKVTGAQYGIVGISYAGTGAVTVHADGDVTGKAYQGVRAISAGGDVYVGVGGSASGQTDGIYAYSHGAKAVTVKVTGNVYGTTGNGVFAASPGGDVKVDVGGDVHGGTNGVSASTSGAGGVTISVGGVTRAYGGYGVAGRVEGGASTGDVQITTGAIYASDTGAIGTNAGAGKVSISTGYVRSYSGRGIYARTAGSAGQIDINASGFVYATSDGVVAHANGGGGVNITTYGGVRSGDTGILATSAGGTVNIKTGYVSGYFVGVYAATDGATAGGVHVYATSQVNSAKGDGVRAYVQNAGSTGDIYVSVADSITAGGAGVRAVNAGSGDVYVGTRGVYASGGPGIRATGAGKVYVHNYYGSNVHGSTDGIYAVSSGAKLVQVYAGGDVTGDTGAGVVAASNGGIVAVTVYGDVKGATEGVYAHSTTGKGSVGVYVGGNVTSGAGHGIDAAGGSGLVSVTAPANIYATGGDGVHATGTGQVGVYVGGVTATGAGVYVHGGGFVRAVGGLNGGDILAGGNGVEVITTGASRAYIASFGDVHSTGGKYGLHASSQGGYAQIRTYGDVTADAGDGIVASSTGKGDVRVATYNGFGPGTPKTITAAGDGIRVTSDQGNLDVLSYANIVADPGIVMNTGGSGTVIVDSFGTITAKNGGIVTSTVDGYNHVFVYNTVEGDSDQSGVGDAVHAVSTGTGEILVHTYADGKIVGHNFYGIYARAFGASDGVTVVADGDIGSSGTPVLSRGILAEIGGKGAGSVSISGAANIYATGYGVVGYTNSTGSVTASLTGNVTSTGGNGVDLRSNGGGAVSVTTSKVTAAGTGIVAIQGVTGTGAVTVHAYGNIVAKGGDGILVASHASGAVSVVTTGSVTAGSDGVRALEYGAGGVGVTIGGTLHAVADGIYVRDFNAAGDITVTLNGDVGSKATPVGFAGVYAFRNAGGTGAVTVKGAGDIYSGLRGVSVYSNASGAVGVDLGGNITTASGEGVRVRAFGGGQVDVTLGGAVVSPGDGVFVRAQGGSGAVNITTNGLVDAAGANGIYALSSNSGAITVNENGGITGNAGVGIRATATGGGAGGVTVHVNGDVGSSGNPVSSFGVVATNASGPGDVLVDGSGAVFAGGVGVRAVNNGSGKSTVNLAGVITAGGSGVVATAGAGGVYVTTHAAVVSGGTGIVARNYNSLSAAPVTVTAYGQIDASVRGIDATSGGGGAVTVNENGGVTGKASSDGVYANSANGAVTVHVNGDIGSVGDSVGGFGVTASNGGSSGVRIDGAGAVFSVGTGLQAAAGGTGASTVDVSGPVTAGGAGIVATSKGGAVSVTAKGVISAGGSGVYASTSGSGGITIKTAKTVISSTLYGVYALSAGAGNISIVTSDTVTAKRDAIHAKIGNAASTGSITVKAYGTLSSAQEWGIQAFNYGTGDITITTASTANVTGTSYGGVVGIGNGAITVHLNGDVGSKADAVSGGGVYTHALSGSKTITIDGSARIYAGHPGIYARHDGAGGSIYVNHQTAAATIVAGSNGIDARTTGAGSGTITVKNAASITAGGSGIYADMSNAGATGALAVTNSGLVDASFAGISGRNDGTGGVTITDTGGVTGKATNGIFARGAGGDVTVHNNADIGSKADAVSNFGVDAVDTAGSGTVTVDGTGRIFADGIGIYGRHDGAGGSVYINHQTAGATINAGGRGIVAQTNGAGAGTITIRNAAAVVSGGTGIQADASNAGNTGTVTIVNSALIDAGASGIYASNAGSGGISVTDSGGVTGKAALGIVATESGSGGDVSVRANGSIGSSADHVGLIGILARNTSGTGAVRVYAQGVYADGSGIVSSQGGGGYSSVRAYGNIVSGETAKGGAGISASSTSGYTLVAAYGNITAANNGIVVTSTSGGIGIYTQGGHLISATKGDGIYAGSTSGSITVNSHANITADPGINLKTGGSGVINVYSYGTISAMNGGIVTETQNGSNRVFVHNTVEGDSDNDNVGDGVHAHVTGTGALLVHTYAGGDIIGNNVVGIYAVNDGTAGNVSVVADGNIGTSGLKVDGSGINAWVNSGGSGNVSVTGAGNIFAGSRGIYAFSNGNGSITVNTTGNITSALGDGVFARANGASSGVSVTTTGTITAGGEGIYAGQNSATATGLVAVNASGLIDASGDGIRAHNSGAAGVTVIDTGAITGKASNGIIAQGAGGNVIVHNNAAIGSKADSVTGYGVYARNSTGSGTVTVDGTGKIYAGGIGIFAEHDGAGGSVYVNHQTATATINAGGRGIDAITTGAGAGTITVKNAAAINSAPDGIYTRMFNAGATGAITIVNSGFIDNLNGTGIYAKNAGTGGIVITDTGGISGDAGNGIVAFGAGGNVSVHNNAAIGSSGNTVAGVGVYATNSTGSGTTLVDGTGKIYATGTGIFARHQGAGGSVYVNHQTAGATIKAGARGIEARMTGSGAGTIVVKNAAAINAGTDGIYALNTNATSTGAVSITNSGAIDAFGVGLFATSQGSGAVTITDTGGVSGDATYGEAVQAFGGGAATVHHNADIGSSANHVGVDGVFARASGGSGSVVVDGSGVIWADRFGIYGFNTSNTNNSSVTVTNTAAVHGGVDGIRVRGAGTGASALTVNSSAKVYGGTGDGISVIQSNAANTGAVTITSSAAVVGGKAGVRMGNAGSGGAVFNNNNTTVYGGKYGVYSNTATTTVINNNTASTISGKGGFAIDVTGGATTINNQTGSKIFGYAHLAGGNDVLNNNLGGKVYAYGTTSFAGGTDTVNNGGSIFVAPFNSTATTVNWTGLEVFNNQGGVIDLRQTVGHTGDVFNLGTAAFTGTTVGVNDSRLFVDVNLSAALATDELIIGAAAGNTSVVIRDINPTAVGAINLTGVTVVDATSGTGSEFHMVPAVVDKGFVQYELRYFAAAANWNIVGLPSAEGFEMLKSVEAGQDFWRHTADVWTARRQEARDANWSHEQRSEGWEMWAQAHAGGQQSDRIQSFLVGPFTLTHNLSVDSDWRGFQMGGDHHGAGGWDWGFMGGFTQQESRIHADGNSFDLEGWNAGAWTGFTSGAFFANGLIKGDWFSVDANMHTVPAMGHFDGNSWGVKGEAGWRMGSASLYFEPVADVDWISTHLDDANFTAAGASFTFKNATSAKGSIGARVGGQWGSLIPYVGLAWVDEFQRSNGMTMITGAGCPGACVTLNDKAPSSYGKADFGFTVKSWGGLEGFLKGEELFSGDYSGFTGRLGVRWRW